MAKFLWWKRKCEDRQGDWLEDRPISKTDNDCLHFDEIINPLATLIAEKRAPLTIGIYGEWGSGKTSFLNLLKERLETCHGIKTIWFDAWKYDKKDNLWAALIQTILNEAGKQGKQGKPFGRAWVKFRIWLFKIDLKAGSWEVTKKLLALLLRIVIILLCIIAGIKSVDIGKALTRQTSSLSFIPAGVSSVVIAAIVSAIGILALDPGKLWSLFAGDIHFDFSKFERELSFRAHIAFFDDFSQQFQTLINLLHPCDKPLVVIIDDLDRCLPAHTLQVLEAIKVFLDSANCTFLLGVDKKVVEIAAAVRFKSFSTMSRELYEDGKISALNRRRIFHEEYLDKIIPLALTIPQPGLEQQISTFIKRLNNNEKDKEPIDKDVKECTAIFNAGLPPNLRKIKRTLYSFCFVRDLYKARLDKGEGQFIEIDYHLLAKLIIIQNQFIRVYEDIISQPSLPGELEKGFTEGQVEGQEPSTAYKTSISYENLYGSRLKYLLLEDRAKATFIGKNILYYITLIGSLADIGPLVAAETSKVTPDRLPLPVAQTVPANYPAPASAAIATTPPGIKPGFIRMPRRNQLFTARKDILHVLRNSFSHESFSRNIRVALYGLGGVGKTQIAIEYAYLYGNEYKTILWLRSATRETLLSDYMAIAEDLGITSAATATLQQNQNAIRDEVKSWLGRLTNWLLIYDGVSDLNMVQEFFPPEQGGHILLTTRMKITEKEIAGIEVNTLQEEESIRLLLRRAGMIEPGDQRINISSEEYKKATDIVALFDGLPLALDQAGAYIEETRCGLNGYLNLYHSKHIDLLQRRSSRSDYPEPVATTWSLSFDKVENEFPAAWELLRLCAFLAPDDIPLEMFEKDATTLGPILEPIARSSDTLNEGIDELEKFSLVRRSPNGKTLAMLGIMQDVLKADMAQEEQRDRANRALLLIYHAFPEVIEPGTWKDCQLYLPHTLACAKMIKQRGLFSKERLLLAAQLLDRAGYYLRDRAQYDRAVELLQAALALREELDPENSDILSSLNNLATLYNAQRRYNDAEPLLRRALKIGRSILGDSHPDVAAILNEIGMNYLAQGKYGDAERSLNEALVIREQLPGAEHPDYVTRLNNYATSLNNLASLYYLQGSYDDAIPLYEKVLDIRVKTLGEDHLLVATSLNNLAGSYCLKSRYDDAIPLFKKALDIRKKTLGERHPDVAIILHNLAELYVQKGDLDQAGKYHEEVLNYERKTESQ